MTSSDSSGRTQAFLGAAIGAAAILVLSVLYLAAMTPRLISNPETTIGQITMMFVLGALIAIPSMLIAAAGGAVCGPLVARLVGVNKLPAVAFPLVIAVLISPFVLLPIIQIVLWLHDTMRGVVSGFRTVFDGQPWRQFWPLVPLAFGASLVAGVALTARVLSIPIASASRWLRPLDKNAWSRT